MANVRVMDLKQEKLKVNKIIVFLFPILIYSCIGTVEEKNPGTSKTSSIKRGTVEFEGLSEARAIGDTKIEIFFNPAIGNPNDLVYQIYIGSQAPLQVPSSSLISAPNGMYYYIISNLQPASAYNV